MYRTDFWTLWEKARVGWSERISLKQVYYQGWNRPPAQVGCMRQVLGAGALGRPRGMGWGGRWEGGSGWGTHVNSWLIHVHVRQKPLWYCKVINLQLIKINEKKKNWSLRFPWWLGGKESSCQCGRHLFHSRSGKIPHAMQQQKAGAQILNLCSLECTLPECCSYWNPRV